MNTILHTEYGDIEGLSCPLGTKFLGVPFAKPPVGELRFRHPVPPDPWEGVLPCKKGKSYPLQAPDRFEYVGNASEDCLYLNVFVPEGITKPLPTMVWIHGGAYESGGIGAIEKDGDRIFYDLLDYANDTNTVVVTVAYRMNVEGFVNLHALSPRFDSNNGLYDIKMALEFVRRNIAAFGGDPDNVTLFGESAGGALTLAMLASDLTCDLFHRAIVQSACVEHFWSYKKSAKIARMFLRRCGVKKAEDLLTIPWERVRKGMKKTATAVMMRGNITPPFAPVIDGEFLKDMPSKCVLPRKHPMLIGTITHEGDLFVNELPSIILHLMSLLTPAKVKKGEGTYRMRAGDAVTRTVFLLPAEEIASNYAGTCHMFYLDCVTPEMEAVHCRSTHSADIVPLFGMKTDYGSPEDPNVIVVGKLMRRIWKDFAHGELKDDPYRPDKKKILIDPEIARKAL